MRGYRTYQGQVGMWYGMLPSHWHIEKAKRLFHDISEKNYPNEPLLSATQESGVVPRDTLDNRVVMPMGEVMQYKLVQPGDFVISLRSFEGGVEYSDHRGLVSPAYTVLRSSPAVYKPYFKYLLKCHPFVSELNKTITGIREGKNINYQDFREIDLPYPPRAEQDAIVAYLDGALAEIDRFIAAKTRLIALLRERKAAIINRAVTRGLDAGAPTKPSGIAWLGDVPARWEVKRNKFIFREVNDRSADGSEVHLSMSQKLGLVPTGDMEERTLQSEDHEGFKLCQVNDLVLNRLKAHLGVFARATMPGAVSPDYTVLRLTTGGSVQYFEMLFRHPAYIAAFNMAVRGIVAGFWRLYTPDFYDIRSVFPPPAEQRRIIEYIESESRRTDYAITTAEREIELMREYRMALISDAVTGKIDVRGTVTEPAAKEAAVREEARI